jgi:hypothetical protein
VTALTHIAGLKVRVGSRLRQRCGWCGAMLADYDLTNLAVWPAPPPGEEVLPAMWTPESLVRVDGNAYFVVEHVDGADLPADACACLDDAVTT